MAKLTRLLNLTAALLESPVPLTAEEIRTRIDGYPDGDLAFHRAFERDKDDLRELGVPIETVTVGHLETPKAGYTIDEKRYSLRDPGFTPEELATLQLARTAVMLEGIEANELEDTFRKLGRVGATEGAGDAVGSIPLSPATTVVFEAINERRELGFVYAGVRRSVRPLSLEFSRGHWYLGAYDLDRDGMRNFRLDRIEGEIDAGERNAFSAEQQGPTLITSPWATGEGPATTARVLLDRGPAQATLAEYGDLTVVEERTEDGIVVEAEVRNPEGFYGFLAGLLERAEVLEPPVLRDGYITWLLERTADGPGGSGA